MTGKNIMHEGIIEEMDGNRIRVKLSGAAGCDSCLARGACSVSGESEKILTVSHEGNEFREGEKVQVSISQALGFRAMLLGYGLPFFLVLAMLLVMSGLAAGELASGLASLGILLPYYAALRYFKRRIDNRFQCNLTKHPMQI